jgi:hypothetical protein
VRVGVLGEEDEQRLLELQMERGQEEREAGLGHPRAPAAKIGRERDETFRTGELEREGMKSRLVHDERRNREVPPVRVYSGADPRLL